MRPSSMLRFGVFLFLFLAFSTREARAQDDGPAGEEPSYADKAEAARLADQGMVLYQKEDFAGAVAKFEAAEKIVGAPTIMLQHGRSLERLGRWVEAVGKYRTVADVELKITATWQQKGAKAEAVRELERLGPRLPKIRIVVSPPGAAPALKVDGRDFTLPVTGDFPVDPGEHVVEGSRPDGSTARKTVTAEADRTTTVQLVLSGTKPEAPAPEPAGMHPIELAGWVGVGVSGLCLLVAVGTGVPAIMLNGSLDESCPNGRCQPSDHGDVSTYDALRWTAGITLVSGALIAGGAVAAIMLAPKGEKQAAQLPLIRVGPTSASLEWKLP